MDIIINFLKIIVPICTIIALATCVHCWMSDKMTFHNFFELFEKNIKRVYMWFWAFLKEQMNESASAQVHIVEMCKEMIEPIKRALVQNGYPCVEVNSYIQYEVAHYCFFLSDKEVRLDIDFMEKLVQLVFCEEILPLYQNIFIKKENVKVLIKQENRNLFVYVGHSEVAYNRIANYKEIQKQRELEELNQGCKEMVE